MAVHPLFYSFINHSVTEIPDDMPGAPRLGRKMYNKVESVIKAAHY